jgi:PAS domain-containing protein
MRKMTKSTRRVRNTTTRKTAATRVASVEQPQVEGIPADNSDLARLLNAPEWEVTGALEALFEAASESITIYDTEGRIVRANATFYASVARLFPGELPINLRDRLGQHPPRNPWGKMLSEEEWPQTRLLHGETLSGSSAAETMAYTSNGKAVHWSVTGAPLRAPDGHIIGAVAIHRDITEQKRLEEELRRSHDELEQRVAERTRELEEANEELARLNHSITRGGVAWALREWQSDLDTVNASVEAELYAAVAELVVTWLQSAQTFDALLEAYFRPDLELTQLITELCMEGEILLRPYLVMGAACALRLQQILATIGV